MAQVIFYLLESEQKADEIACTLAANAYRSKQRCSVTFNDQSSAEAFDELLWQKPVDGFIPHNLMGEGPKGGAPVELVWDIQQAGNRPILINLSDHIPTATQRARQVFDFVPAENTAKQQARERYKQYRAAGHQLDTQPASNLLEQSS